ncbi:hypothetical protein PWG14_23890, partial [Chromobacterium amazonense]|uniref:pyocin knob domain-containing protein n=1 Tax=Chromobacterium amazonense TaxID=1382803 RepID=UPI002A510432|nr:hypothetical protein [Chromobacterium amazonense]
EYADRLKTPRNIAMTGDGSWNVTFDASGNVSAAMTLSNSGVTAGSYGQVTVDAKGRVTAARAIQPSDVPALDWSKISSGKPTTLAGYGITDAASKTDLASGLDGSRTLRNAEYLKATSNSGAAGRIAGINASNQMFIGDIDGVANLLSLQVAGVAVAGATKDGLQLNGAPTAPTPAANAGGQQVANVAYVKSAIDGVVAGAPGALNTLKELADALGSDGSFAVTVTNKLASKADKATTLAGYGITDAASKDANNRSWASAFRASKGLPNGDESRAGFAFEADGDTGLFADGSGISGSSQLSLHIDSKKIFQVSNVGRMWTPAHGFFDESFSQKTETIRTLGQPTDKVDWNNLLDPGIYTVLDTTFGGLNAPPASYLWGSLQVMRSSPRGGAAGGVTQIYTAHGGMSVWFRTAWNDASWQPWQQLWHSGNLAFSGVLEGNGYQKLPSGLIIQWGQGSLNATLGNPSSFATALSTTGEVTFRTSFPSACCSIMVNGNENGVSGQTQEGYFWVGGRSKEKATIGYTQTFGSSTSERTAFDWFAIGY